MYIISSFIRKHKNVNWAIVDQAIVSAINFATGILIARNLGLEDFGRFTLLWMLIIFLQGVQHSIITSPMLSLAPKYANNKIEYYFGAIFIQQLVWVVVSAALVFVLMLLSVKILPHWRINHLILPLICSLVSLQMQDFFRRYFFAIHKPNLAFMNDSLSYLGQLLLLLILFYNNEMKIQSVLWVVALTSLLACCLAIFYMKHWRISNKFTINVFLQHWNFSKWLLYSTLMQWISGMNFFLIITGIVLGPISVGAIKSAQNIVGLINIIFLAMENFVPNAATRALVVGGKDGLVKYINNVMMIGLIATLSLSVFFGLSAEYWMEIFYGIEFVEFSYLVQWFSIIFVLFFPSLPFGAGLKALEMTRSLFRAQFVAVCFSVIFAYPLISTMGLYGYLIGAIGVRIIILLILSRDFNKQVNNCC